LLLNELELIFQIGHQIIVNKLILSEDIILFEVFSESFLFFVGENFEFFKLSF